MSHETFPTAPSSERHHEQEKAPSPFNLDQMEPRQIAGLLKALDMAWRNQEDNGSPDARAFDELIQQLHRDLREVVHSSDNALEIYDELVTGELANDDTQYSATLMIPDLLRENLDNSERKQKIVELAARILQGDGLAQEEASYVVAQIVWKDWLDEPTARYLDNYLQEEDRRWS